MASAFPGGQIPANIPYTTTDFKDQLLPLIIGVYFSFALFGASCLQFYYCGKLLKRSTTDEKWNWAILGVFLAFDIADTIAKSVFFAEQVKGATVKGLAAAFYPTQSSIYPLVAMGGLIPFFVHLFYIRRIVRISRNWKFRYYVWAILVACFATSCVAVGFAFKSAGIGLRPAIDYFPDIKTVPIPWLAGDAAVDGTLCFLLIAYLATQRSDFTHTNAIVTKWIAISLETGLVPASVALADILLAIYHPDKTYHLCANFILAKVYINSVLVLFHTITRNRVKGNSSTMNSGSAPRYISKNSRAPLFSQSMAVSVNVNTVSVDQSQNPHSLDLGHPNNSVRGSTEKYPGTGYLDPEQAYPSYSHSPKA
ncbi:hypothetical protein BT69DRAFT_1355456 [Atractiella rhizophila]|nr:hypothetical protein BT69DRAFT_1355456 [Atractiella rhizophila]